MGAPIADVTKQTGTTHIGVLDPNSLVSVFSRLDTQSLGRVARVCREWNQVSSSNASWEYQERLPYQAVGISLKEQARKVREKYYIALSHSGMKLPMSFGREIDLLPDALRSFLLSSTRPPALWRTLVGLVVPSLGTSTEEISVEEKNEAIRKYLNSLENQGRGNLLVQLSLVGATPYAFELLLELGIDLDATRPYCPTFSPLAAACYRADEVRARLLLQHGATVTASVRHFLTNARMGAARGAAVKALLDGMEAPFVTPTLTGQETDQQLVDILYKMPKQVRQEILAQVRNRPDFAEICPTLFALPQAGANLLRRQGDAILATATRDYLTKPTTA